MFLNFYTSTSIVDIKNLPHASSHYLVKRQVIENHVYIFEHCYHRIYETTIIYFYILPLLQLSERMH